MLIEARPILSTQRAFIIKVPNFGRKNAFHQQLSSKKLPLSLNEVVLSETLHRNAWIDFLSLRIKLFIYFYPPLYSSPD